MPENKMTDKLFTRCPANELFEKFCSATTSKTILTQFKQLCVALNLSPTNLMEFYPELKKHVKSWKADALWIKLDKRASNTCYNCGKSCATSRVLIIGGGPCGLRAAIEAQLLGAKVVVVEKRDTFSRNNVLHLWPFVIHDLRALGAKTFYGKFCAGAFDHISIQQLQSLLLKIALILGVEVHVNVTFEELLEPRVEKNEKQGWRARFHPKSHPIADYEFDVLICADGKRNTLEGFKWKEFRAKLAIAITANFVNRNSDADARVDEIGGVAFIFKQQFFKDLKEATGIDLENITYYKTETHYFIMTVKKRCLLEKGVIISDTSKLFSPANIDREKLMSFTREAANFSTKNQLPRLDFCLNHNGEPDVAIFDFTSLYAAENSSFYMERMNYKLLMALVGDSLLKSFWPTGTGCARGFLSCLDACWSLRSWCCGQYTPLDVLAERESVYRILGQTTSDNLKQDFESYTLDPRTRYSNLKITFLQSCSLRSLCYTDNVIGLERVLNETEHSKKRRSETEFMERPEKVSRMDLTASEPETKRSEHVSLASPAAAKSIPYVKSNSYSELKRSSQPSTCTTKYSCPLWDRFDMPSSGTPPQLPNTSKTKISSLPSIPVSKTAHRKELIKRSSYLGNYLLSSKAMSSSHLRDRSNPATRTSCTTLMCHKTNLLERSTCSKHTDSGSSEGSMKASLITTEVCAADGETLNTKRADTVVDSKFEVNKSIRCPSFITMKNEIRASKTRAVALKQYSSTITASNALFSWFIFSAVVIVSTTAFSYFLKFKF